MVRHEAAEGLAALCVGQHGGDMEEAVLQVLQDMSADGSEEVAETCKVAEDRLRWQRREHAPQQTTQVPDGAGHEARFVSVDPAPPMEESTSIGELERKLLDQGQSLFDRYRAMFRLRNLGGPHAGAQARNPPP